MHKEIITLPTLRKLRKLRNLPKIKMLATPKKIDTENHIWITAYELEVPVKQMTTEHIKNCIACWNGVGNKEIPSDYLGGRAKWLKIFNQELINR